MPRSRLSPSHLRVVRLGQGANCSSVGSVIDTLFVSAAIGGAIYAAVVAALDDQARRAGDGKPSPRPKDASPSTAPPPKEP